MGLTLEHWAMRSPEPVAAQTGEGLALLSAAQGKYFVLNETAAAIWEGLARPIALHALAAELAGQFGIPRDEAGSAVIDLVAEFHEQNIVRVQVGRF